MIILAQKAVKQQPENGVGDGLVLEHRRSFRECARERTAWSSTPFCFKRNARKRAHGTGMTQKTSELYILSPHPSRAFLDLSEVWVCLSEDLASRIFQLCTKIKPQKTQFFYSSNGHSLTAFLLQIVQEGKAQFQPPQSRPLCHFSANNAKVMTVYVLLNC